MHILTNYDWLRQRYCVSFPLVPWSAAERNGHIYGFALPNKTLIPEFLYVLPAYRKNGIGKMLVEKLESSADCTASMIFYHKSLRDYYSKMGYQVGDALEVAMKEIPNREGEQNEI